ncbi:MAG: hypothetical protein QW735_02050 [archaeon]
MADEDPKKSKEEIMQETVEEIREEVERHGLDKDKFNVFTNSESDKSSDEEDEEE